MKITFNGIETGLDENKVIVKNPIDSTVPSAAVRVDLALYADDPLGTGDEITVDFSGPSPDSSFIVPSSISKTGIDIEYEDDANKRVSVDISEVLVQGNKVILTVPSDSDGDHITFTGDYTIIFRKSAGIKNPFSSGSRIITVSSLDHDDPEDEITAVIRRTTTIDPLEGPRGSEFTLTGKGYGKGTVTIYHDANNPDTVPGIVDAGETLASVKTVKGAFKVKLEALGVPGDPGYIVKTKDSTGVDDVVTFTITSAMSFQPATVGVGDRVRVLIADWEEDDDTGVAAVRVGGRMALMLERGGNTGCYVNSPPILPDGNGMITIDIEIPRNVPAGEQTVAVYGPEQLGLNSSSETDLCHNSQVGAVVEPGQGILDADAVPEVTETIEIAPQALTLYPATAVRGQRITIVGSGFTRARGGDPHTDEISINGICENVLENHSDLEVGTNTGIALTVTVPIRARYGENEVRVEGWDGTVGHAVLTVPEAAITIDPERSGRGSKVNVTGAGFVAHRAVTLSYGDGVDLDFGDETVGVEATDGEGNLSGTFNVPLLAPIGQVHKVTAFALLGDDNSILTVRAEAEHVPVNAVIATTPESVSSGDHMMVRGENLPAFTVVGPLSLAGVGVAARGAVNTDEDGTFEVEVLVPHLALGDQVLRVQVGREIVTHVVKIAPPPLSGPTTQVFKDLVRQQVLTRIWRLDRATQTWSLFDSSPEYADFNTLSFVESRDIVWLHLSAPFGFQGDHLVAGWNEIALK